MERNRLFDSRAPATRSLQGACDVPQERVEYETIQAKTIMFVVQRQSRVWVVTMAGEFYGEFAEERLALEAAQRVAFAICKAGGKAEISLGSNLRTKA